MLAVKFKLGSKPETHFRVTKSCQTSPCAYLHGLCERKTSVETRTQNPWDKTLRQTWLIHVLAAEATLLSARGADGRRQPRTATLLLPHPHQYARGPKKDWNANPIRQTVGRNHGRTSSRPHRVLLNFISRTRHLWKTILKSSMPPAGDFRWPTVVPFLSDNGAPRIPNPGWANPGNPAFFPNPGWFQSGLIRDPHPIRPTDALIWE